MPSVAIVGTGIAGLGAAYFLHRFVDLTLWEANAHVGGHVNTLTVVSPDSGEPLAIDTGFMVFNRITYPLLCRLFDELTVATFPTDMSFSVQAPNGLEWGGASYNQLFGQRRNLFHPGFWQFLMQLNRFNKEARHFLDDPAVKHQTLADYVAQRRYGHAFMHQYLLPMTSAIWSAPPEQVLRFPAHTLLRFFHNHGFLGMDTHYQWYTVTGGAKTYVDQLIQPFRQQIRARAPIVQVQQREDGVWLTPAGEEPIRYDAVILACHADQALSLLANPTPLQQQALTPFTYEANHALLHTDARVMPRSRRIWSAWNYRQRHSAAHGSHLVNSTHYWMNRLQALPGPTQYFVTLNDTDAVNPNTILAECYYTHPRYTVEAVAAQHDLLPQLQQPAATESPWQGVYCCGSYFRYGFHEDAFGSAVQLTRNLLGAQHPWLCPHPSEPPPASTPTPLGGVAA